MAGCKKGKTKGSQVNIRSDARTSASSLIRLNAGTAIEFDDSSSQTANNYTWYKVAYGGSVLGYMATDFIETVDSNKSYYMIEMLEGYGMTTWAQGMTDSCVKLIQKHLNDVLGTSIAEDGIFGSGTKAKVEAFQEYYELSVDGKVGPKTKGELFHQKWKKYGW